MVEFESILPYIDQIETLLNQKKSPKAIAAALNIPEKWMTIHRYKKKYFNTQEAAATSWMGEQQKPHEERFAQGKEEIINTLEVINLAKKRARELLALDIGVPYETADGQKRALSYGGASIFWQTGQKMICESARSEQELIGDDPESRKASAIESLSEAELDAELKRTLAIIAEATGIEPSQGESGGNSQT